MSHENRSLEQAERESEQVLRKFSTIVAGELDGETTIAIEINGVPVGTVLCLDSALEELAAGWSLLHRYCDSPREFDRATETGNRVAVMLSGGKDIEDHRQRLIGAAPLQLHVPDPWPRADAWSIPDDVLLDILREAWQLFRRDRMAEGSVHAALASNAGIEVVAFDLASENAVAKVLGWSLRSGQFPTHEILIVNGLVTRATVDAAVRVGVLIIATPNVATRDAWQAAHLLGISIVGYMRHRAVGLFHDAGLVEFEAEVDPLT